MALTGRRDIFCDENIITQENVMSVLRDALKTHLANSRECDYLYKYYKGEQPILSRVKSIRPEICNKMVENRAYEAVSFKTGYLAGEPIQYISRSNGIEIIEGITKLNDTMLLCDKPSKDNHLIEWMYVCGVGYRLIIPHSFYIKTEVVPKLKKGETNFSGDEAPFEIHTLDPRNTFVVKNSGVGNKPVMAVNYVKKSDGKYEFGVYTQGAYYTIIAETFMLDNSAGVSAYQTKLKEIPIIEYSLNNAKMGIIEIAESILNAINTLQSNRIDGVEQFVQSLIVLTNAEIDEDKAKLLRDAGLIKLTSFGDNKPSLEIVAEQLDQQQTQTLINYLYQAFLDIIGMPNRNTGGTNDVNGVAVLAGNGFYNAEARAKSDELMFKPSDRRFLKIVLDIMRDTIGTTLKLSDIEIKFTRRNYDNIGTKSTVLTTMLSNEKIHPQLAFTHSGMFTDPEGAYQMSNEYYTSIMQEQQAQLEKQQAQAKVGDAVE